MGRQVRQLNTDTVLMTRSRSDHAANATSSFTARYRYVSNAAFSVSVSK